MNVVSPSKHPESDLSQSPENNLGNRMQLAGASTVAAIGVILLAAVVRIVFVPLQSLTWDELYELQTLSPNFSELVSRSDGFPPLFPILISNWNKLVTGDNSARWFSVVVGMLSFFPLWILARSIESDARQTQAPSTGTMNAKPLRFFVIVFACLNPLHLYFSTEGRAYALMLMLSITCVVCGLRAVDSNRLSAWLGFAVAGVLGVYTHYYSLFVGILVLAILLIERKPRATMRRASIVAVLASLALIPMLWVFRSDLETQVDYAGYAGFSVIDVAYTYFSYLSGFCIGPSLRTLHSMPRDQAIAAFLPWVLLLGSAAVFLLWQGSRVMTRRWMIRLFLWGTIPVALSTVATLVLDVNYNVRYTIPSWAPVIVWLAAGASTLSITSGWQKWCTALAVMVLLGSGMFALVNRAYVEEFQNADFRTITQQIEANSEEGTTVFVNAWYQHHPLRHYLPDEWVVTPVRTGLNDPPKYLEAKSMIDSVPLEKSFVFLYSREFHGDHNRRLFEHIKQSRSVSYIGRAAGIDAFFFPSISNH